MINETEHLLSCLAEECCETGQRVSKALRFSLEEIQRNLHDNPKQLNNAQRISEELGDAFAVGLLLVRNGIIPDFRDADAVERKWNRIEQYMEHARATGALAKPKPVRKFFGKRD